MIADPMAMTARARAQTPGSADAVIRPATRADIVAICELYVTFHDYHAAALPGRLSSLADDDRFETRTLAAGLARLLQAAQAVLLVADHNGSIVGMAEVHLHRSAGEPGLEPYCYAYLQSLMVDEHYRSHNIGARLLAASESWARDHDVHELRLDAWEFPGGPTGFYEHAGYDTLRRTMVRRLG